MLIIIIFYQKYFIILTDLMGFNNYIHYEIENRTVFYLNII